jgi:hypothetical protein
MSRRPFSFHVTVYGTLGRGIPTDLDGYTYTSIAGWLGARMDWSGFTQKEKLAVCREKAREARAAINAADAAVAKYCSADSF